MAAGFEDRPPRPRGAAGGLGQTGSRPPGEFTALGEVLEAQPADAFSWRAPESVGAPPGTGAEGAGSGSEDAASATATSGSASGPARPGARPVDLAAAIVLAWPHVVGEEVAANTQPVRLTRGRLAVAVSSTVWAQTLQFMEQTITAGLNERLGRPVIEGIAFRHAGWREPPPRALPQSEGAAALAGESTPPRTATRGPESGRAFPLELTPEQQAALRSVEELGLEPRLAEKIVAAMTASFVRAQQDSVR